MRVFLSQADHCRVCCGDGVPTLVVQLGRLLVALRIGSRSGRLAHPLDADRHTTPAAGAAQRPKTVCPSAPRSLAALPSSKPQQQIAHRARHQQLAARRSKPTAARLSAAVISYQPGNRRLDLPATRQQGLASITLVELSSRSRVAVIGRHIHKPHHVRLALHPTTGIPQSTALTLPAWKGEAYPLAGRMWILPRAALPIRTRQGLSIGAEYKRA